MFLLALLLHMRGQECGLLLETVLRHAAYRTRQSNRQRVLSRAKAGVFSCVGAGNGLLYSKPATVWRQDEYP